MESEIERKGKKVDYGPEMRAGEEVDRLSSLPDEIIHHILSFVDTKLAVQTCVLSTRWKLVWTFLPHLNLASHQFRILPNFSKFVNRVLSHRNSNIEVSAVDLTFRGRINQKFVKKIASYAMSHNVQKIKIDFDIPKGDDQLPPCLFDSESLKHLSLSTFLCNYDAFPCSQSPWNFPSLTTLDLKNIWLCYDDTNSLDLFSKCVNLKNLTLEDCFARNLGVMQILCPQLLSLTLKNLSILNFSLSTPNLSNFCYEGESEVSLSTDGLPCLDTVNLNMYKPDPESEEERESDAHRLLSMLRELGNAINIKLHVKFIEFLATVPDILDSQRSPFSNLKCLKIKYYQKRMLINSAMIDEVIKYLVNYSSTVNVIKELPEERSFSQSRPYGARAVYKKASFEKIVQDQCKHVEMLSPQQITDPLLRQLLEDVKVKLALQCRNLGLPPPRASN